ncbi:MAG: type II toxin-antitoxin system VapC family toxin [candidate division NC10 bacterium]|nr:type II toxin-antitoxin system VapC family toxin [candidate division NC10 bacterium]
MKYLLDTDHLSILQRQSGPEYAMLMTRIAQHSPADLASSIISFHEQVLGCHTYISRAHSSSDVVRGYGMFVRVLQDFAVAPVIPFDAAAAAVFDGLVAQRVRVATMDLRIASIALSRGMVLVTRNVSDFGKVPGLQIEDWTV